MASWGPCAHGFPGFWTSSHCPPRGRQQVRRCACSLSDARSCVDWDDVTTRPGTRQANGNPCILRPRVLHVVRLAGIYGARRAGLG